MLWAFSYVTATGRSNTNSAHRTATSVNTPSSPAGGQFAAVGAVGRRAVQVQRAQRRAPAVADFVGVAVLNE
jgi:hypothetical protein